MQSLDDLFAAEEKRLVEEANTPERLAEDAAKGAVLRRRNVDIFDIDYSAAEDDGDDEEDEA